LRARVRTHTPAPAHERTSSTAGRPAVRLISSRRDENLPRLRGRVAGSHWGVGGLKREKECARAALHLCTSPSIIAPDSTPDWLAKTRKCTGPRKHPTRKGPPGLLRRHPPTPPTLLARVALLADILADISARCDRLSILCIILSPLIKSLLPTDLSPWTDWHADDISPAHFYRTALRGPPFLPPECEHCYSLRV
jgi:hypothetical protein